MKWIKASEQLPEYKHNEYIYLRFLDTGKRMLFQPQSEIDLKGELDFLAYHYKLDIVEYLDESPAVSEDVKEAANEYALKYGKEVAAIKDVIFDEHDRGIDIWDILREAVTYGASWQAAQGSDAVEQYRKALIEISQIVLKYHQAEGNSPAANHCRNIALESLALYSQQSKQKAMDTIEGNKIIAGFMNFYSSEPRKWIIDEDHPVTKSGRERKIEVLLNDEDLEYHSSWNWLMPVVEKIGQHKYTDPSWDGCEPFDNTPYPRTFGMRDKESNYMVRFNACPLLSAPTLIEATWLAVVQLIQDYNNQQS